MEKFKEITNFEEKELKEIFERLAQDAKSTNADKIVIGTCGAVPKHSTTYERGKGVLYHKEGRRRIWLFDGENLIVYPKKDNDGK